MPASTKQIILLPPSDEVCKCFDDCSGITATSFESESEVLERPAFRSVKHQGKRVLRVEERSEVRELSFILSGP